MPSKPEMVQQGVGEASSELQKLLESLSDVTDPTTPTALLFKPPGDPSLLIQTSTPCGAGTPEDPHPGCPSISKSDRTLPDVGTTLLDSASDEMVHLAVNDWNVHGKEAANEALPTEKCTRPPVPLPFSVPPRLLT